MRHQEQTRAKPEARGERAGCQNVSSRFVSQLVGRPALWLLTKSQRLVVLGGSQTNHSNVPGGVTRRPTLSRS